jgi:Domain of unknown function (DUF4249)
MQKLKYFKILFVGLILGQTACETIIDLEVPNSEPVLIVESVISNDTNYWDVNLSFSQQYFDQSAKSYIDDAFVTIMDNLGNTDTLTYQDTGRYSTPGIKWCEVGRVYTLTIVYKDKIYTASEMCKFQEEIDFLMSFELPDGNGFIEPGFYVFEKAGESEVEGDYYLWKIYKNDTLEHLFGYLLDTDEFREASFFNLNIDPDDPLKDIDKNILPRPFPINFEIDDVVRVEQYNISKAYFDFLLELQRQVSRSGTPFDPPPVNPRSNIQGGGFGFFSVVNVSKASIVVSK